MLTLTFRKQHFYNIKPNRNAVESKTNSPTGLQMRSRPSKIEYSQPTVFGTS